MTGHASARPPPSPGLTAVNIGTVRVTGASGLEARRMADALPAALAAALAEGAPRPRDPGPVERAAWAVADVVRARMEGAR
jgi:hypothetical protein